MFKKIKEHDFLCYQYYEDFWLLKNIIIGLAI